ncbi:uncharacterized protein LY89DRAFT_299130 [Mollisia scopiformis]|uniref:Uncharacterized protein n=1 Tax=Mollisia scopiformis TaxID=149040 RepID=A0A194XQA4_MOLSC|nr:uncharacterized protein LY89DRAFT_299130 [Mollisia scopiformis]KUJ22440.1 hypothetical protein LY89DRAFT_299130 [Mollisia scopiformis]
MRSRLLLVFIFSVFVFCQAEISLLGTNQGNEWVQAARLEARDDTVIDCKFVGNADFYGIGVRIGFYLIWIAGFLDFTFNPSSSVAVGDAQTIFDFANVIAIIVLNNQQRPLSDTTSTDRKPVFVPIILLYMFFGGAIVSATTTASFPEDWLKGSKAKKFSTAVRQIFVHSTFLAMMGYGIYFFVSGYRNFDLVAPCKDPPVGPLLFPLSDPVSFTDSPIIGIILMPLILILYILVLYVAVQRYSDLKDGSSRTRFQSWMPRSKYHRINDWLRSSERQLSWTILGALLMLTSILWSIVALEWTIAKNDIQGVNDVSTTGQLIPLIIGIFSLPTTFWSIYKSHVEEKRTDNEQKEESEFDTPLKHLTFKDAGLESPMGAYMSIQPRHEHNMEDQSDMRPASSQELREARTF